MDRPGRTGGWVWTIIVSTSLGGVSTDRAPRLLLFQLAAAGRQGRPLMTEERAQAGPAKGAGPRSRVFALLDRGVGRWAWPEAPADMPRGLLLSCARQIGSPKYRHHCEEQATHGVEECYPLGMCHCSRLRLGSSYFLLAGSSCSTSRSPTATSASRGSPSPAPTRT